MIKRFEKQLAERRRRKAVNAFINSLTPPPPRWRRSEKNVDILWLAVQTVDIIQAISILIAIVAILFSTRKMERLLEEM